MQPRLHRWRWASATKTSHKHSYGGTHAQHHLQHTHECTLHTRIHSQTSFGHKSTNSSTHAQTRTHHTHHHTGEDGGPCLACSIGKYKSVRASVGCSTCPLNANSSAASTNQTDCKCNPGYTGEDEHPRQTQNNISQPHMHSTRVQLRTQIYTAHTPQLRRHTNLHTGVDGGTCLACSAGKYKPVDGSAECSTCPLNSNSSDASTNQTDCKCNPGYTGEDEHPRQTQNNISQPHMHASEYKITHKSTQRTRHI